MKKDMTPQEVAAYAAGIIDGEGSIHMSRSTWNGKTYPRCQIEVTGTCFQMIDWLHQTFKGSVGEHTAKHATKQAWRWCLSKTSDVSTFITLIYPYLIIKLPQARIALSFLNREWYEDKEHYFMLMKEANKKGGKG